MKIRTNTGRGTPELAESRADKLLECAYLLLLAFYTLAAFRTTTMLDETKLMLPYGMVQAMRVISVLVVSARIARERPWRLRDVIVAVLLCGALIRSWQHVERSFIFELAVLLAGAHGVDFGKIIRVHFYAVAAALIVTVILALTGVIENLVYYRVWTPRMAFGIIYPTDFAAQVFFLTAAWAWIRQRKITWGEIAAIAALAVFCYVFCDARNSVACMGILAAGLAWLKLRRRGGAKRSTAYRMHPAAQWACVLSAPVLAAAMILLSRLYNDGPFMASLNGLLSERLHYGSEAFQTYSVNLFGQEIYMMGLGGSTAPLEYYYFFLDSSYMNILFCYGAVTLAAFLAVSVLSAAREKNNRAWERLGILAVVALQCAFEHHYIELAYNPFLLLALAASAAAPEGPAAMCEAQTK